MHRPEPILVADLLRPLHDHLVQLLEGFAADDWNRRTKAPKWTVKDVAAHLLDGDIRRLSFQRDGQAPPAPRQPITDYPSLVDHLNALNATWTVAARRMSPRVILELLRQTGPQVCDFLASLDPHGEAIFPVAWAGQDSSHNWFDIAREYTEKWHHQQQIREAVDVHLLTSPRWVRPALDAFMRGLPYAYQNIEAPDGTQVLVEITGEAGGAWTLARKGGTWTLYVGSSEQVTARAQLSSEVAWRTFSRWISPAEAQRETVLSGNRALGIRILDFTGFMV